MPKKPRESAKPEEKRAVGRPQKPVEEITLSKKEFRVVGIGASAGGLEAIEQFFSNMPSDSGLAFVIVQHLDPTGHSSMPEILSRFTKMRIHLTADGMKVEPDSVYFIPPNKDMGIRNGRLFLQDPALTPGLRLPIDYFFRSLAGEKGADAICIVLSGTGTDGTLGLKAIKAEMGTVFVQDLESAKYDGMPRSAVNTGLADFVLKPGEMPEKLIQFIKHSTINGARLGVVAGEAQQPLQHVFAVLRTRTGHDFSRYKQATVRRRLERRMSVNEVNDVSGYVRLLKANEDEAKALLKDLLISVTNFFRDPGAFAALKAHLKELIRNKEKDADLRVWVPGCASGEEAYSVGIVISECLEELDKHLQVQMYATDIDVEALHAARSGLYPVNIAADVTPERLRRFFIKEDSSYRVKKEIRENIVFAPQDFVKDPPFSRVDLICCRNLLIYLESDMQKRLLPLLHYALRPGGILFLGTSESVGESADLFSLLDRKWKIYQRREAIVPAGRLKFPSAFVPASREPAGEAGREMTVARIPQLMEKIFLDQYAPTFAVIDEKFRLVYVRGRTGKYLEIASGQPNLSILEMAREGLRTELSSGIYRAISERARIVREGVRIKNNGGFQTINLTIAPLTETGIPSGLLMVVFQEVAAAEGAKAKVSARSRKQAVGLEEDLRLARENLQSSVEALEAANEELKAANEELQSNNEELQSTNEELDTSREELQSLNEELTTLNAELQDKNGLLIKANDDLKNFLNRTDIAIIFLDEELKIRSYTPATSDVFNIRDIDVGRPLGDITPRLEYAGVVVDALEVLRTLQPKEIEVQRKDGHWYTMRVLPYLTVQNTVSGLVISFLDIDKQKQAVNDLAGANKHLQEALEEQKKAAARLRLLATIVTDSNDAIVTQDMHGNIVTWNRGAERMYGYSAAEALKTNIVKLVPEEENEKSLRFFDDIKSGKKLESLEVKRKTKDGRLLDVWLTTTRLVDESGKPVGVATTERDITERNKAEGELKRYSEELKSVNKELDTFSSSIAHDLKAPSRRTMGLSQAIIEDYADRLDDKGKGYLQNLWNESRLMTGLIEDLLDFSRVATAELDHDVVNLSDMAEGIAARLMKEQPERRVEWVIHPDLKVSGDRPLLKQVMENLLDNAFKFTGQRNQLGNASHSSDKTPPARLEVGVLIDHEEKKYFIKDNGVGFNKDYADKMFIPFGRLHSSAEFPGNGIGLAIVKRVINRHGGRVWAESETGKGASFYFTLPDAQ